ncbi:hypothetical protein EDB82DRAFT_491729 [Fusarium venenatum]|uniref:uncharacterized protein n=1 Tax=Fusarium venenatum TaxID=56646 RepID=UPI001D524C30|nr:hypothetical protein EDB82DRAFT_491729 [Fusarium venenatum]
MLFEPMTRSWTQPQNTTTIHGTNETRSYNMAPTTSVTTAAERLILFSHELEAWLQTDHVPSALALVFSCSEVQTDMVEIELSIGIVVAGFWFCVVESAAFPFLHSFFIDGYYWMIYATATVLLQNLYDV